MVTQIQVGAVSKPVIQKLPVGATVIIRGDVANRHATVIKDEAPSPFAKIRYLDGTCETVNRALVRLAR